MNAHDKCLAAVFMTAALVFCSSTRMASAARNAYSEAILINQSQFLHDLKEVTVTFAVDPWIAKYIPAAEQQMYVKNALARYGIAVRSNAPVALLVTLDHVAFSSRQTTILVHGPNEMQDVHFQDFHFHYIFAAMDFFVRAGALRDGTFHLLMASPAGAVSLATVYEQTEVRRMVVGDELGPDIRERLADAFAGNLKEIDSSTKVDTTPWPVNGWSEENKGAANAAYTTLMNTQSEVEKRPIEGLNSLPKLHLKPETQDGACVQDPSWTAFWQTEFQRLGWVNTQEGVVAVDHSFWCSKISGPYPDFFTLWDLIDLLEYNLVFELNGRLVRKSATIASSHRVMGTVPDQLTLM